MPGSAAAACLQRRLVGGAERTGHGPGLADVAGEAAGVDAGDAGDAGAAEEGVEVALGAPAAASPGQLADDDAPAEGPAGLVVGRGDPVVADVGVGEADDLPGVAGVGDDLLVAGEGGVEHHLAGGHATVRLGADGLALEDGAVGQHELGLADRRSSGASPSRTVGSPHSRVWRTRPRTVRPA